MRIANPQPGFCSCCFNADPDVRYVDFEAAYDGAPVLDRETQTIAVLPWSGDLGGHDDLYLCAKCIRQARELLGLDAKPQRVIQLEKENRQLTLERDHFKDTARRLRDELNRQLDSAFGDAPKPRVRAVA